MSHHRYIPLLRPAGFATLPSGITWDYAEAPARSGLADRPELPRSVHLYGVITTDRPLTAAEMDRFSLLIDTQHQQPIPEPDIGMRIRSDVALVGANLYAVDGLCHNSEPGTFGHECGKPARFIGKLGNGMKMGFCVDCRWHGAEADQVTSWERLA